MGNSFGLPKLMGADLSETVVIAAEASHAHSIAVNQSATEHKTKVKLDKKPK